METPEPGRNDVSYRLETRAMLKNLLRSALLLSLAVAFGCAHKNPPPDFAYDHTASFAGLKTYAWFDDPTWVMPQGNSIVDGQFIDRNVREAVSENLNKKDFAKVENGDANFYVAYHGGPPESSARTSGASTPGGPRITSPTRGRSTASRAPSCWTSGIARRSSSGAGAGRQ